MMASRTLWVEPMAFWLKPYSYKKQSMYQKKLNCSQNSSMYVAFLEVLMKMNKVVTWSEEVVGKQVSLARQKLEMETELYLLQILVASEHI